jgi:opacity protein-like surface antigen
MKNIILSSMISLALSSNLLAEVNTPSIDGTSIGGQIGMFGLGLNAKAKFSDTFGVRASFDKYKKSDIEVETDDEGAETKYNFDLDLNDIQLVADYHPWAGSFKLVGGLIINGSNLDGDIYPSVEDDANIEFDFNGKHYSYKASELGSIHTKVDWDPVAPYLGIGWDTSFAKDKGFGFTFDVGVAFQGSATASYDLKYGKALDIDARIAEETADIPDGPEKDAKIKEITDEVNSRKAEIDTELKKELDKEMKDLQDDLDDYKVLPYISLGVNYKF